MTSSPLNESRPIALEERSSLLDALRGFAIIGVLADNLFGFTGWGFLAQAQREALATWPADGIIGLFEIAFVHGKFYSILSLLFGLGFSIQLARNSQRGVNGLSVFYRRLLVLAIFGALHLVLLWEGDILLLYALTGMLLPLFLRCKDRTLLIWAIVLILSPMLIDSLRVLFNFSPGDFLFKQAKLIDEKNKLPTGDEVAGYLFTSENAWEHWRKWQEPGFFFRYGDLLNQNRPLKVLGMFLFGLYAGRKLMYLRLADYIGLFRKLRKWGLIIGIPTGIATAFYHIDHKGVPDRIGLLDTLFYTLSVVPLCLAYVSWFCLQWLKTGGGTRWKWLIPFGRMTLTNYLMQTIICITIFYGVGFGLGGNMGPSLFIPIAIVIYLVQLFFSKWWLSHFNFGPFEWIWRMLTYWKWIPLKKKV